MAAASDESAFDFEAFTFVGDFVGFGVKLVGACGVEVAAFFANRKEG